MTNLLETLERRGARIALSEAESRLQELHVSLVLASELDTATGVAMALNTIRAIYKDQKWRMDGDADRKGGARDAWKDEEGRLPSRGRAGDQ